MKRHRAYNTAEFHQLQTCPTTKLSVTL